MTWIADALRAVGARMQQAIDAGQRSVTVDAEDLIEVLLALADELDPPASGAPNCADQADQPTAE
jgi:hypothetical protein